MLNYTLITGGSKGIGLALAQVFASHNHNLILIARDAKLLTLIKDDLESKHSMRVEVLALDLSVTDAIQDVASFLKSKQIYVDVLVNNAAMGDAGAFISSDPLKNNQMLNLNMVICEQLISLVIPQMQKRGGGRILNVASSAGYLPGPYMALYHATKSFVLHFSLALSCELKGTGISVTTLCPGPTQTNFQKSARLFQINQPHFQTMAKSSDIAAYAYRMLIKNKRLAVYGFLNKVKVFLVRILPVTLVLVFAERVIKKQL